MLQSLSDGIKNARWLGWLIVGLIAIPFALWGIGSYVGGGADAAVRCRQRDAVANHVGT